MSADIHLHPAIVLFPDGARTAMILQIERETGRVLLVNKGVCLFVPGRKPPVLKRRET